MKTPEGISEIVIRLPYSYPSIVRNSFPFKSNILTDSNSERIPFSDSIMKKSFAGLGYTLLFKFVNTQTSVDGILSPIVNDKRVLYHIGSRTIKEFEVNSINKNIIEVGKLELQEKGFHNSLKLILTELEIFDTKLVLVIRDYLMKETIIKYNLDQFGYEIMEI